ncbi:MAG: DMT family transporter [Chloroflexi bacterium]|nr:DMT family transporter [Chloroflexota bacterium]
MTHDDAPAGSGVGGIPRGTLFALAAVIAFSTSPILVLWAAPLSPFEITVGRLASATMLVWLLARLNGQPLLPRRADLPRFVGFGFVTALHFLSYIASLNFTTIAHSLAIVYTAPIFVTLFSVTLLKEPIARRKWLGVIVAVLGITVLAGFEPRLNKRMILGDLLALASAITFGLYSVAGRSQRQRYGLFTYAGTVYGLAALWMLPAALLNLTPAGYRSSSLLALLAAGLIPLGVGHTLYNAALRRTHATTVNLIATQEVTGGVLLGALLLGQMPQVNEIVGAAIALAGIVLVLV